MDDLSPDRPGPAFVELYRSMSEQELQEIGEDWHGLVDEARSALVSEFSRRGLSFHPPLLVEEPQTEYRNLVTLRQYRDLSEAIVARAVVESAGIYCFLKDENFVRLDWQMSNLIGGIRLQVPAADVQAAEAVLSQPVPDSFALVDQPDFKQPRCPRCASTDIAWERRGRKAALFSLYLFSIPLPRGSESWHCDSCDLRWTEEDNPTESQDSLSSRTD
jgi:hypothetical protein